MHGEIENRASSKKSVSTGTSIRSNGLWARAADGRGVSGPLVPPATPVGVTHLWIVDSPNGSHRWPPSAVRSTRGGDPRRSVIAKASFGRYPRGPTLNASAPQSPLAASAAPVEDTAAHPTPAPRQKRSRIHFQRRHYIRRPRYEANPLGARRSSRLPGSAVDSLLLERGSWPTRIRMPSLAQRDCIAPCQRRTTLLEPLLSTPYPLIHALRLRANCALHPIAEYFEVRRAMLLCNFRRSAAHPCSAAWPPTAHRNRAVLRLVAPPQPTRLSTHIEP